MDYKSYYLNQPNAHFSGAQVQRGYGIGDVFKRFFKWFLPVVSKHALPVVKKAGKSVGKELINATAQLANDTLEGKDFKASAQNVTENAISSFANKITNGQLGSGKRKRIYKSQRKKSQTTYKKKYNKKRKIEKRNLTDIFD